MMPVLIIYLLMFPFTFCLNCTPDTIFLCRKQTNCWDCLRVHTCCNWCYDQNSNVTKCDLIENLSRCSNIEKNMEASQSVTLSKERQIKQQRYKVVLRKDVPVKLKINYKAEKDYPLELYYLTDLSFSMRNYVEIFKNLGDELGKSLTTLTKNFKLAFGSFLDKPGMPFTLTDKDNQKNPCRWEKATCNPTYLFKHTLNFTANTDDFFQAVKNSEISANVDDIDGALEAIQQILYCYNNFGWTENSRKLIVLSTDSHLHTAGDGLLVGAVLQNKGLCLINHNGEHIAPLTYDYPSISEIRSLLRQYKVNVIVAAPENKYEFYEKLKINTLEKELYVGRLNENASNILNLVSNGFKEFIRQVEFSTNTSHIPQLEVKFFSDCDKAHFKKETQICRNIKEYKEIEFEVQLTLKEWIDNAQSTSITITEKNINEDVTIDLEFADACKCKEFDKTETISKCEHGVMSCDTCRCTKGWKGEWCTNECDDSLKGCIQNSTSIFCSARGDCSCGKCECKPAYVGEFCEFECPVKDGKVCNGFGTCSEGKCSCDSKYSGVDCSCSTSTESCKLESDMICSGNGECQCNTCKCTEGFQGTYCQKSGLETWDTFCNQLEEICKNRGKRDIITVSLSGNNVTLYFKNDETDAICKDECSIVDFTGTGKRCVTPYCYEKGNANSIKLFVKKQSCIATTKAYGIGLAIGIFTVILGGGLIMVFLKKYHIYKLDQAEFKKYIEMQMLESKNENPLYNSPVRSYSMPVKH